MSASTPCTECGHDQVGPRPAAPLISWATLWPVAVILLGLVALVFALRADAESSSGKTTWGSRYIGTEPTTIEELADLAAGKAGPELYQRLLARHQGDSQFGRFPDSRFEFGYSPISNVRHSYRIIGWPLRVWSSTVGELFDDPVHGVGFRPLTTHPDYQPNPEMINPSVFEGQSLPVPRWAWWAGTLQYAPPPEERDGRLETRAIFVSGLGAMLGLIAFAWLVGGAAGVLLDLRRRRQKRPLIGRHVRRWSAALAAVVMIAGTIMNARSGSQVTPDYSLDASTRALPAPTLPVTEFMARQSDPDRNRWLAARLLEDLRPHAEALRAEMGASSARPLALSSRFTTDWERHQSWTGWGDTFPLVSTQSWSYIPPASDAQAVKDLAPVRVEYDGRRITFHRSPGPNLDDTFSVDLPGLGTLSLAIFLLFGSGRIATALARNLQSSRRRRRHACVACGHPLPRTSLASN